jgi:hypothetical protein
MACSNHPAAENVSSTAIGLVISSDEAQNVEIQPSGVVRRSVVVRRQQGRNV